MIGGVPVKAGQEIVQIGGGEFPLERLCCGVVTVFERSEPVPDLGEVGAVVGRQDLALNNREVDLHLVQSGGAHGGVDHHRVRQLLGAAILGAVEEVVEAGVAVAADRLAIRTEAASDVAERVAGGDHARDFGVVVENALMWVGGSASTSGIWMGRSPPRSACFFKHGRC